MELEDEIDRRAIALYVKDGGRMCEWHAVDPQVRHFFRRAAKKEASSQNTTGNAPE